MNNKIAFVLGLAVGAATGTVASWRLLKRHYKRIAEEEIESVKKWYQDMYDETEHTGYTENKPEVEETPEEKAQLVTEYHEIVKKYDKAGMATVASTHPYTISPEEFGEKDGYETITLSYYADGVLADYASDELVEEVDALVGTDSLNTFGEYEQDAVYVRNDANKTDYEIIRDSSRYTEIKRDVYTNRDEE